MLRTENQGFPFEQEVPIGSSLSHADYDTLPDVSKGGNAYGPWLNLGGDTVAYAVVSSGILEPGSDIPLFKVYLQKALDAIKSPRAEFS